jgi:hypothetical protein
MVRNANLFIRNWCFILKISRGEIGPHSLFLLSQTETINRGRFAFLENTTGRRLSRFSSTMTAVVSVFEGIRLNLELNLPTILVLFDF